MPKLLIDYGFSTKSARTHENQDAVFFDAEHLCFGVFDGIGGMEAGEHFSDLAAQTFARQARNLPRANPLPMGEGRWGRTYLMQAYKAASEVMNSIDARGGTTAVAGHIQLNQVGINLELTLATASLGDSRSYLYRRGTGSLRPITIDNLVEGCGSGDIAEKTSQQAWAAELPGGDSAEVRRYFERDRNVVHYALMPGQPISSPIVHTGMLHSGDIVLLCSDGVHDNLMDSEMYGVIAANRSRPAECIAEAIIEACQHRAYYQRTQRSKDDDMTALVLRIV